MKIQTSDQGPWMYYFAPGAIDPRSFQIDRTRGEIRGKYLFFSPDPSVLESIARHEIQFNEFQVAKISTKTSGKDYVLCLYWANDSRKHDLANRYRAILEHNGLKYRYWKSDADTVAGVYSEQHKAALLKVHKEESDELGND
jgi:hypothetical protein